MNAVKETQKPVGDEERTRLLPAKEFLETCDLTKPHGHVQAAKLVHLSPFHFHRRFRLAFGTTPKAITAVRQVEAAKKLMQAGVPFDQISAQVGYSHQSHFTMRFKQHTGQTPARWLKANPSAPAAETASA